MIKNIIFDWSGTLSDDIGCIYATVINMFKRLKIKPISLEKYRKECTLPYMNFYKKYTDAPKKELDKLYSEEIKKVEKKPQLYPDVKDVLKALRIRGIRIVILSSQIQPQIEEEIEYNNLKEYFVKVVGSVHDKVQFIGNFMKDMDFKSEETVYVGDMVHDVIAGNSVGVKTVGITWGYHTEEMLRSANPDCLIKGILELEKILENV